MKITPIEPGQPQEIDLAEIFRCGKAVYVLRVKDGSFASEGFLAGDCIVSELRTRPGNGQRVIALESRKNVLIGKWKKLAGGRVTLNGRTYEPGLLTVVGIIIGMMRVADRHIQCCARPSSGKA